MDKVTQSASVADVQQTYLVNGQKLYGADALGRELERLRAIRKSKGTPQRGHKGLDQVLNRIAPVTGFSGFGETLVHEWRRCRYERLPNGDPYRCGQPSCRRCGEKQKVRKAKLDIPVVQDMLSGGEPFVSYVTINADPVELDEIVETFSALQKRLRNAFTRDLPLCRVLGQFEVVPRMKLVGDHGTWKSWVDLPLSPINRMREALGYGAHHPLVPHQVKVVPGPIRLHRPVCAGLGLELSEPVLGLCLSTKVGGQVDKLVAPAAVITGAMPHLHAIIEHPTMERPQFELELRNLFPGDRVVHVDGLYSTDQDGVVEDQSLKILEYIHDKGGCVKGPLRTDRHKFNPDGIPGWLQAVAIDAWARLTKASKRRLKFEVRI